MVKIILTFLLLCMLLLPVQAFADDAGLVFDSDGYLSVKITPENSEIEIGEEFRFEVVLTNNYVQAMERFWVLSIFSYYPDEQITGISKEYENDNIVLKPGESVSFTVTVEVPYLLDWYVKDGEFYTNINFSIAYWLQDNSGDTAYEMETIANDTALKITNLNDGTGFLGLGIYDIDEAYYFQGGYSLTHSDLFARLRSMAVCTNLTFDKKIENLMVQSTYNNAAKDRASYENSALIYLSELDESGSQTLESYESVVLFENINCYLLEKDIPEALPAYYKAAFMIDGKYYAVGTERQYPTKTIKCPNIEFTYKKKDPGDENSEDVCVIKNLSSEDYANLYIDYLAGDYNPYGDGAVYLKRALIIGELKKNEELELPVYIDYKKSRKFIVGYLYNDLFLGWKMYSWESRENEGWFMLESDEIVFKKDYIIAETLPTPSPAPTSTPSPSNTPAPTASPTQAAAVTSEPTQPPIEITSVKKTSSIPLWVWIVLGAAIIGSGILVFFIRKKGKAQNE